MRATFRTVFAPAALMFAATLAGACAARGPVEAEPPNPAFVAGSPLDGTFATRHRGVFGGESMPYRAEVERFDIDDADGRPGAQIVAFSYLAEDPPDPAERPVLFAFNGGPIAPSVYLHMGSFGPWRVVFDDDIGADPAMARLERNPHSILDVTDLVFFDPAGTGLSRPAPGKDLKDYFSVEADGQQTAAFIAAWLDRHGRRGSPVYVFGESYGTMRGPETVKQLAERPEPVLAAGVVLFGQAVNIIEYAQRPDNILSYVVSLPTLAAIGWYHGQAERAGMDLDAFADAAWEYARTEYLDALFLGNALPAERLAEVAGRLEDFTGLDTEFFAERRLRVSKEEYRVALFADEGLVLGMSDGRYLAERGEEERVPDPASVLARTLAERFPDYLRDNLGVTLPPEHYLTGSPVGGLGAWDFGGGAGPFSRFAYGEAITQWLDANPSGRVLVGAGHFDTMTTTGSSRYLVDQSVWPREQVTLAYYYGGHMAYSVSATAAKLAEDLRRWIRAGP